MSLKESQPFGEFYLLWLAQLLPTQLHAYLQELAEEQIDSVNHEYQVLNIVVQGYDFQIKIIQSDAYTQIEKSPTQKNLLYQIAHEKFSSPTNPPKIDQPVLFSSTQFPGSPALEIIKRQPDISHLSFRVLTDHFNTYDIEHIMNAIDNGELTTNDLTDWQRARVVPSTYLLEVPQTVTTNPNYPRSSENYQVSSDSPWFPPLTSIEAQIRSKFEPQLKHFIFDASLKTNRRTSNVENADTIINLILATQLIQNTRSLETTEDIYEYIQNQNLNLDFDALYEILVLMIKPSSHVQSLLRLGIVDESFSLHEHYTIITKWLVICAQMQLIKYKTKLLVIPFSYTELDIPIEFITHAMNSLLLFLVELPPLLKQVKNERGSLKSPWPKLFAAGRQMIGDQPDSKKKPEELVVSYFNRVILKVMNTYFEKKYQVELNQWEQSLTLNKDLPMPVKILVSTTTMNKYFEMLPADLQNQILDQIPAIEKAKNEIERILLFYGKNPRYLTVGEPKDKTESKMLSDFGEHLSKHGLRTSINQAGGNSRVSSWANQLFQED